MEENEILEKIIRVIHRCWKLAANSPSSFHLFTKHEKGFIKKDPVSTKGRKKRGATFEIASVCTSLRFRRDGVYSTFLLFVPALSSPPSLPPKLESSPSRVPSDFFKLPY